MTEMELPHVLSIQSHVVSGYVGNRCATFSLQLLGFEVDVINSVQLSNHTGYKVFKGQVLNDSDLNDLVEGLAANDLDHYTHLLTGYIGSASFLKRVAQVVKALKKKNPDLIYVCDPVMGDNGKMYVPEELKNIYRDEIIPLADIITPNQYEVELLLEQKINSLAEIKSAMKQLHNRGPKIVAVSSTDIDDKLTSVVSSIKDNRTIKIDIPKIPALYTGSGDLFAALFLGHCHQQENIATALEKTINSLHDILLKTYKCSEACTNKLSQEVQKIELRLVQSKRIIENPTIKLFAQDL